MPFITEEIWQQLPHRGESDHGGALSARTRAARTDGGAPSGRWELVIELVTAVRNIRGEMGIAPGVTLAATARVADEHAALFERAGVRWWRR